MRTDRWALLLLAAGLFWCGLTATLSACDTPVYRYAMYRWPASKYYVFFVHQGEATADQKAVNKAITDIEDAEDPKPNVVFFDIKAEEIDSAPPIAADHWKKIGKPQSTYIVVAPPPLGGVVYTGDLKRKDVHSMVSSPLRTEIANRLEEGAATVFVLLEADESKKKSSKDDKAAKADNASTVTNKAAEEALQRIVARVNVGDISLYATPKPGEIADNQPLKPEHKIAMVKLSRDNPDEQWLIRMLLSVESDLHEFNQPMVFPVYGRGRVHPPFLGLGVTEDNLVEAVQFVTGACSCTVKEQNPGVDLLFDYDWESAAVAMAEKFGVEEGNEQLGAVDLFPELIIPGNAQTIDTVESGDSNAADSSSAGETETVAKTDGAEAPASATDDENAGDSQDSHDDVQIALAESTAPPELKKSYEFASIWAVIGVLVVAVAGLFVATLFILRPR